MTTLPTPPVRGQPVTADLIRSIIAALRARTPIPGTGIRISETPAGFRIDTTPAPTQTQTPSAPPPPPAAPPEPFDLRTKTNNDGKTELHIYDPRGTYEAWTTPYSVATRPMTWRDPLPETDDPGWHTFGPITATVTVTLLIHSKTEFQLSIASSRPDNATPLATVTLKEPKPPQDPNAPNPPPTFTISRHEKNGPLIHHYTEGTQALVIDTPDGPSEDLTAIPWTPDTVAHLVTKYGDTYRFQNAAYPFQRNRTAAPYPTDEETNKPVYASSLTVKSHAAEHYQGYLTNESPTPQH